MSRIYLKPLGAAVVAILKSVRRNMQAIKWRSTIPAAVVAILKSVRRGCDCIHIDMTISPQLSRF